MPYGITKSWKRILADRRVGLILARKGRKQTRVFFGETGQPMKFLYVKPSRVHWWRRLATMQGSSYFGLVSKITVNILVYFHDLCNSQRFDSCHAT